MKYYLQLIFIIPLLIGFSVEAKTEFCDRKTFSYDNPAFRSDLPVEIGNKPTKVFKVQRLAEGATTTFDYHSNGYQVAFRFRCDKNTLKTSVYGDYKMIATCDINDLPREVSVRSLVKSPHFDYRHGIECKVQIPRPSSLSKLSVSGKSRVEGGYSEPGAYFYSDKDALFRNRKTYGTATLECRRGFWQVSKHECKNIRKARCFRTEQHFNEIYKPERFPNHTGLRTEKWNPHGITRPTKEDIEYKLLYKFNTQDLSCYED